MIDLKQTLAAKLADVEPGSGEAKARDLAEKMAEQLVARVNGDQAGRDEAAFKADSLPNLIRQVETLATEAQAGSLADPVLSRFQSQILAACPGWLTVLRGMQ